MNIPLQSYHNNYDLRKTKSNTVLFINTRKNTVSSRNMVASKQRIVWERRILLWVIILLSSLLPSACFCSTTFALPPGKHLLFDTGSFSCNQRSKRHNIETKLHVTQRIPSFIDDIEVSRQRLSQSVKSTSVAIAKGMNLAFRQSWWCFPMALVVFPFICLLNGSYAQMPSWWSMPNLHNLHNSSKIGHLICTGFLFSNIFYFLSGLYLLNAMPLQRKTGYHNKLNRPILGWLLLSSGGISLLYHTVQSLGPLLVAESLCFVDHGLAISSACCFFDRCGRPSLRTLTIGVTSLSLLAVGADDVYPIIHSFWHIGSAAAAVLWAYDGVERRKRYIRESLQQRRLNRNIENNVLF